MAKSVKTNRKSKAPRKALRPAMVGVVTLDVDMAGENVTMFLPDGQTIVMTEPETEAMATGLWTCLSRLRRRQLSRLISRTKGKGQASLIGAAS